MDCDAQPGRQLYPGCAAVTSPMRYELRPATDDRGFLWDLLVATMKGFVEQIWAWDEADQRRRFAENFPPGAYQIIRVDGEAAGAVAVEERPAELWLGSILILPA